MSWLLNCIDNSFYVNENSGDTVGINFKNIFRFIKRLKSKRRQNKQDATILGAIFKHGRDLLAEGSDKNFFL